MRPRLLMPLLLVLSLAVLVPSAAEAKYRVGIGEQNPAMFDSPDWQKLKLKRTRYLVPWNWNRDAWQDDAVAAFMDRAREARQDVLVQFTAARGCWNGKRYSRSRDCRAPSRSAYRRAFKAFDKRWPWVRTYGAWNEMNHASQPTAKSPRRAAGYYDVLRRDCRSRRCKVMAADLLDTSNMASYAKRFLRYAKGSPRLWGLHNYQDVNRRTSHDTRRALDILPGEIWLTETGGIVQFLPSFKYSPSRAASRTRWMFTLANRYDTRRHGLRSKITRLFVYKWFGEPRSARFDAGLVNDAGEPRKAFRTFRSHARSHR